MAIEQLVGGRRDLGARFHLVNLVPSTILVLVVLVVLWSGAPGQAPDLSRALDVATGLDVGEVALLAFGITVLALVSAPLQRSLVRTLEGYWLEQPWSPPWLRRAGTAWSRWRFRRLSALADQGPDDQEGRPAWWRESARQQAATAVYQRWRRYPAEERLLAGGLGNALRAAEDEAGQRYWPALYAVLGDRARAIVDDQRMQLDVAARLAVTLVLSAVVAAALLRRYPPWALLVPAGLLVLAWLAHRAAISAAVAYGDGLRLAFDQHRFDLLRSLHLPLPADSDAELAANRQLSEFLARGKPLQVTYWHDQAPDPPADDAGR